MSKDSLERRLQQLEKLARTGYKPAVTVYSEVPGEYYTLDDSRKVAVTKAQMERLKASATPTLVVLRDCEEDARSQGIYTITTVTREGMMMTGRILAGERTEQPKGGTNED
ncbi:MAG: hypothetical protein JW753_05610 [Dehalococcoidia bacterium]|nr:hypothetical protein [Dehalococcoidia bacterium]